MSEFVINVNGINFRKNTVDKIYHSYVKDNKSLSITFEADVNNEFDENAVKVLANKTFIGYVPRKYSQNFKSILEETNIDAIVHKFEFKNDYYTMLLKLDI